jgi:hypothetical protein
VLHRNLILEIVALLGLVAEAGCGEHRTADPADGGGLDAGPESMGEAGSATLADGGPSSEQPGDAAAAAPPVGPCTPERAVEQFYFGGDQPTPEHWLLRYQIRRAGGVTLQIRYGDRGPDGQWLTADDVIEGYSRTTTEGQTLIGVTMTPGPDRQWLTADDEPSQAPGVPVRCSTVDTAGRVLTAADSNDPGPDGKSCTADDLLSFTTRREYGPTGLYERELGIDAPGPDGVWFTDDDILHGWARNDHDAAGALHETYYATSPGPDRQWLTADDVFELLARWTPVANDQLYEMVVGNIHGGVFGWYYDCTEPPGAPLAP